MKNYRILLFSCLCLFSILFFGCTHEEGTLPKVKTGNVFELNFRRFYACGLVDANGTTVTKAGICYSTSNSKPDINDSHTDMMSVNDNTHEIYPIDVITGTQPILGSIEFDNPITANTLYVRAYAMTADGKFAYGKTVSFNVNDEHNLAVLLTRPNGWKLESASAPIWESEDHILKFDRTGTCSYIDDNIYEGYYNGSWNICWFSDSDIEYDFLTGTSENISGELDGLNCYYHYFHYVSKILSLTTNELRILRKNYDSGDAPIELKYVPAP